MDQFYEVRAIPLLETSALNSFCKVAGIFDQRRFYFSQYYSMKNMLDRHFRKLSPITLGLLIFAICNLIMNLTLIKGIKYSIKSFFKFSQIDDSWMPMFKGLEYLHSNHKVPIYSQLFFNEGVKFQYLLTSLLPLQLIEQLTSHYYAKISILNFLSWFAIITIAIFTVRVFNLSSSYFLSKQFPEASRLDSIVRLLTLLSLCFMFYPLMKAYSLGQIQVFINLLFTISVWFWLKKKEHISGILIGLIILLKPQYLLIALWGILRKNISLQSLCLEFF